jgi:hypothetical protein
MLRASGKLLVRHANDRLCQPGLVGRRYARGGILILGLNPAAGGDGMSPGDLIQYERLKALQEASDAELISRFEHLVDHLVSFMPAWSIIENTGINAILNAHKISFQDVAYLNVCKWRTKTSSLSVCLKNESWHLTRKQVELLKPARTIVLGTGLWDWFARHGMPGARDCFIPRTRGDLRLAPEALPIIDELKRELL